MVILTNEENKEQYEFEFNECKKDKVFVHGLGKEFYIVSENPYYYQDEDGWMVGLNSSFTEFQVKDSENETIQIITIGWKTRCYDEIVCSSIMQDPTSINRDNRNHDFAFYFLILIFITIVMICRKFNHYE